MNRDVVAGKWKQLRGELRQQWGRITDDELDRIGGNAEKMIGLVQERYGLARDEAERQLDELVRRSDVEVEEPVPVETRRP